MRFLLFQGQMARGVYWPATIAITVARNGNDYIIPNPFAAFAISIVLSWLLLCTAAARLRHMGWPVWLALVFLSSWPLGYITATVDSATSILLVLLFVVVMAGFTIVLGIVPGKNRSNRVGKH